MSPVKRAAVEAGLPVYQPEKVRSDDFVQLVRDIAPDVTVVASFGQIIPKSILDIPRLGNVNVHASLLPKYRGAAPVHYALFNGEARTGITTMLMSPGLDTGPILLQRVLDILPEENEGDLEARLAEVGASLLIETLTALAKGEISPIPQDDSLATTAPSVKKEECRIVWENDAVSITNRVRGCTPRPGAYTYWRNSSLKIWSGRAAGKGERLGRAGEVLDVSDAGILVAASEGSILVTEVQPENKKRMPAQEFARGYGVARGKQFDSFPA
jgi:methionyl-tRNA formyltransferase